MQFKQCLISLLTATPSTNQRDSTLPPNIINNVLSSGFLQSPRWYHSPGCCQKLHFCTAVAPRSPRHEPESYGARCCMNIEQKKMAHRYQRNFYEGGKYASHFISGETEVQRPCLHQAFIRSLSCCSLTSGSANVGRPTMLKPPCSPNTCSEQG